MRNDAIPNAASVGRTYAALAELRGGVPIANLTYESLRALAGYAALRGDNLDERAAAAVLAELARREGVTE